MLRFVGLGLWDERSVTIRGREAIAKADTVFAEFYTSRLMGTTIDGLEQYHGRSIEVVDRDEVEGNPGRLLDAADDGDAVFLVGGDPLVSTTHVDLRLRAANRGIETQVIHGPSAASAVAGLTGLQNYRFGKATTVPFPGTFGQEGVPASVVETIQSNRDRGLHTLAFLDLDESGDRTLTGAEAADVLSDSLDESLGIVVARAGSDTPLVRADRLSSLATMDFGVGLHMLVLPGRLHPLEADALVTFADAPPALVGSLEEG